MAANVLIAGGGMGGLAAALACAKRGHRVQLFERTAALAPVGAGIQLGPNVLRVLHGWGLADAIKAVAAFPDDLQVRSALSGAILGCLRLGHTAVRRYGSPYATIHRADLQALLLEALQAHASVQLTLNASIATWTQSREGVTARLNHPSDGGSVSDVSGDLLVGADGLWSGVRQQLLNDDPPAATGHLAYRALVRQSDLPPVLRSNRITAWLGPKLHVVHYPVRCGEWLNVVGILQSEVQSGVQAGVPAEAQGLAQGFGPGGLDNWDHSTNAAALRTAMTGMCKPLQDLIHAIDLWRLWPLCIRSPMRGAQEQAQGRVALLGDAAHPMLPYLAQGAGMAIEDAAVLADCLGPALKAAGGAGGADVPAQLQRYGRLRWQRNARVQARAIRNGQIFHATGLVAAGRDLSLKLMGERLLDVPWLYGHNMPVVAPKIS